MIGLGWSLKENWIKGIHVLVSYVPGKGSHVSRARENISTKRRDLDFICIFLMKILSHRQIDKVRCAGEVDRRLDHLCGCYGHAATIVSIVCDVCIKCGECPTGSRKWTVDHLICLVEIDTSRTMDKPKNGHRYGIQSTRPGYSSHSDMTALFQWSITRWLYFSYSARSKNKR